MIHPAKNSNSSGTNDFHPLRYLDRARASRRMPAWAEGANPTQQEAPTRRAGDTVYVKTCRLGEPGCTFNIPEPEPLWKKLGFKSQKEYDDAPAWEQLGYESMKQYRDHMTAKHCSQMLGNPRGDWSIDRWTPQRQKECERAIKNGKLDQWTKKHAKWFDRPCEKGEVEGKTFLVCY